MVVVLGKETESEFQEQKKTRDQTKRSVDTRLGNWDGGGSEDDHQHGDQKRWQDRFRGVCQAGQGPSLVERKLLCKAQAA
jgi:hypothetical protein